MNDTDKESSKKTLRRPDRAKKLQDRKNLEETVIKTGLLKHLQGDEAHKQLIRNAILDRCEAFSRRLCFASRSLLGILKELFHEQDVEEVNLPDIFDVTFIRQLMLGVENAKNKDPTIEEYFKRHPEMCLTCKRHQGDSNIYCHGATKFLTNLKNSLRLNFLPRVKAHLKHVVEIHDLPQDAKQYMLFKIMGWKLFNSTDNQNPIVLKTIQKQRCILGLENGKEITEKWFNSTSSLERILRQWVFMNRFREENGLKTFNLIPLTKIRNHFITFDLLSLHGLLMEIELFDEMPIKVLRELSEYVWGGVFKLHRNGNKTFTGTLDTDGVSICMHYSRPKALLKSSKGDKEELNMNCFERKLGLDPGRTNIYTIVEETPYGVKTYCLTRNQYLTEQGYFKASKQTQEWSKEIKESLESLSMVSPKGVSLERHEEYITVFLERNEALWREYTKPRWARQRFSLYGGKQRVFSKFWNQVINGGDKEASIAIAYGAAKFAPGGKGEISVPTSRAFQECKRRIRNVKLVDEFRTSKIDYRTDSILKGVKVKGAEKSLRGLLWCETTRQIQSKFVNRDVNAALNILRCGLLEERPKILSRCEDNQRLVFEVGKMIRKPKQKIMPRTLTTSNQS